MGPTPTSSIFWVARTRDKTSNSKFQNLSAFGLHHFVGCMQRDQAGYNNSASFAHTYLTNKVDFDSNNLRFLKQV